jgi:hypothetical protein
MHNDSWERIDFRRGLKGDCERLEIVHLIPRSFFDALLLCASAAHENRENNRPAAAGFSSATDIVLSMSSSSIQFHHAGVSAKKKRAGIKEDQRDPAREWSITMGETAGKSLLNSQRSRPALVESSSMCTVRALLPSVYMDESHRKRKKSWDK